MKKILSILISAVFLLTSCGEAASVGIIGGSDGPADIIVSDKKPVMLYYADENAEGLVAEEYEISEKTPEDVLCALFDGPYKETSVSVFGEGTRLLGIEVKDGVATVDLSGGFLESIGDSLAVYSVVNTLTELEDIDSVRITVEGSENAVLGNYILSEGYTRNETLMK